MKPLKICISSTFLDLKEYRENSIKACEIFKAHSIVMEMLYSSYQSPIEASLGLVREADIYVCILGQRYGSVKEGSKKSITHLEYEEAQKLGKPSYFFLVAEYSDREPQLQSLIEEISQKHVYHEVSSPHDLLIGLINTLRRDFYQEFKLDSKYLEELESKYVKDSWHEMSMEFISHLDTVEVLQKFEEDFTGLNNMINHIHESYYRLEPDLYDLLDKTKVEQIHYKENPFVSRDWEVVNLGLHNWRTAMARDFYNIKVRLLEYECQRNPSPQLIDTLEKARSELKENIALCYVD
jgi:hypothetical protein